MFYNYSMKVSMKNSETAAIANRGSGDLVINIPDKTTSTLKDGGSSEFDGCIYSTGRLFIEGNGILYVYGNQEEGEGIALRLMMNCGVDLDKLYQDFINKINKCKKNKKLYSNNIII